MDVDFTLKLIQDYALCFGPHHQDPDSHHRKGEVIMPLGHFCEAFSWHQVRFLKERSVQRGEQISVLGPSICLDHSGGWGFQGGFALCLAPIAKAQTATTIMGKGSRFAHQHQQLLGTGHTAREDNVWLKIV